MEDEWTRDLVRVEDHQELAVRRHQCVVEVAGLGVAWHVLPVRGPGDPPDALRVCGLFHVGAVAVVEDPGLVGVVDGLRGPRRSQHQIERFVVGGDENVNDEAFGGLGWHAFLLPSHREAEQERIDQRVGLGQHEGDRDPPRVPVDREQPAPDDVIDAEDCRHEHYRSDEEGPAPRDVLAFCASTEESLGGVVPMLQHSPAPQDLAA